jgi:phosphohistidine phosphatase
MKQLLIMRHGKSAWDDPGTADFERSLNERGQRDIPEMAKRLNKKKFIPDLIVSSDAKRAKESARLLAKSLAYPELHIQLEHAIYQANLDDLIHIIRQFDDRFNKIIMIGHNPTFTGMSGYLSDSFLDHLPTSGMVLFDMQVLSWKQTSKKCAKTTWFDFPKSMNR